MTPDAADEPNQADLSQCDHEPIQIPGSIQPHGLLLALQCSTMVVVQASLNVNDWLGHDVKSILGQPVVDLLGPDIARAIDGLIGDRTMDGTTRFVGKCLLGSQGTRTTFDVIAHRVGEVVILDLEPGTIDEVSAFHELYPAVRASMTHLKWSTTVAEVCQVAAAEVQRITGFDRVLVYRFDPDWNGTVVGEARNDVLPSYFDLRFPSSDIPAQARALYRSNPIRLIASNTYTPSPIVPANNPATGRPLDLSFSTLRSVSPIHLEYMRNMGTATSMSISILQDGQLWGLIACHHHEPQVVPFEVRTACDFLGQVLALQISSRQQREDFEHKIGRKSIQVRIMAALAESEDFVEKLIDHKAELFELVEASGVAILHDGQCTLLGQTPNEIQVGKIADWLELEGRDDVFATDSLSAHLIQAEAFKDQASGLLAIATSKLHRGYLFWFRPEVIRTVTWGGDPTKPAVVEDGGRISPRKSFDAWKETVRFKARPWRPVEIEVAVELRGAILGIVLRRAEERAQFSAELERSNNELEAFSYSVSHDLRAPFRHIVGYSEILREEEEHRLSQEGKRYVGSIIESAQYAGMLVDNLLAFSRMGRTVIHPVPIEMNSLTREVIREVMLDADSRKIHWEVGDLPGIEGDLMMIRLVMTNLASNAVKYTRTRETAIIEIKAEVKGDELVFFLKDNGIGFDMRYSDKLFGVFQRLHRMEDFEGTGIGLANVRRIMSRHGGRAWGEGEVDRGATFYFALPRVQTIGRNPETDRESLKR